MSNFVFHIESTETLFLPFIVTNDISLADMPMHKDYEDYRGYVESILTSVNCKAIICNYQRTKENLSCLFPKIKPEKITVISFLDIYYSLETQDFHQSGETIKNRFLFRYPFHPDKPNVNHNFLNQFLKLSKALLSSNSLKHLKPTIIIPSGVQHDVINGYQGIEVIRGPLSKKIYNKIYQQTSYLFMPYPGINSKEVIDCIKFNIVAILNRHSEHQELGLSDSNSIPLSEKVFDSITNLDNTNAPKEIDCAALITSLVSKERAVSRPVTSNSLQRRVSTGVLEIRKFSEIFMKNKEYKCRNFNEPILRVKVIPEKFLLAPGFLLYGKFNGKYFYTDSEFFLSSGDGKAPSKFSEIMQCHKDSLGNVLFNKEEFSRRIYNSEKIHIKEIISRMPFKEQFKHYAQNYPALFFVFRSLYRLFKRFRNIFF